MDAAEDAPHAPLRVAVLEDDMAMREDILVPGLAEHGFAVEGFAHSRELYRRLLAQSFDMALLDIGLPGEDGLSVARHLRATSSLGIVVLTGHSDTRERVRGLEQAVDVWLRKPVEIEIVAASMRSLSRRMRSAPVANDADAACWRLSPEGWRLLAPDGRGLALNYSERRVLARLFETPDRLVTHEELLGALVSSLEEVGPHRLEMLIHRLRRKVATETGAPLPLRSVRGRGYVIDVRDVGGTEL